MYPLSRRWAEFGVLRLHGARTLFFGFGEFGEFFVPAPFEAVRYQAVSGLTSMNWRCASSISSRARWT
jgi:hypothetical protein